MLSYMGRLPQRSPGIPGRGLPLSVTLSVGQSHSEVRLLGTAGQWGAGVSGQTLGSMGNSP